MARTRRKEAETMATGETRMRESLPGGTYGTASGRTGQDCGVPRPQGHNDRLRVAHRI